MCVDTFFSPLPMSTKLFLFPLIAVRKICKGEFPSKATSSSVRAPLFFATNFGHLQTREPTHHRVHDNDSIPPLVRLQPGRSHPKMAPKMDESTNIPAKRPPNLPRHTRTNKRRRRIWTRRIQSLLMDPSGRRRGCE